MQVLEQHYFMLTTWDIEAIVKKAFPYPRLTQWEQNNRGQHQGADLFACRYRCGLVAAVDDLLNLLELLAHESM